MSNPIPQSSRCHFQISQTSQNSSPLQSSQPASFQPLQPQTPTKIWITNITNLYYIYQINRITKLTPKLTLNPLNSPSIKHPINLATMPPNPQQPPFNWAYQNNNNNPPPPLRHPLPPRPWMLPPRRPIPTAFYLQQIPFYRPGIPPDPYEHESEPDERPPNVYHRQISQFLARISNSAFPILGVLFVGLGRGFWFLMEWLVLRPVRGIMWVTGEVEWDFVFALLVATRLAGFMPRPDSGRVLESEGGVEIDGPVYVLVPEFRRWATGSCFQASRS